MTNKQFPTNFDSLVKKYRNKNPLLSISKLAKILIEQEKLQNPFHSVRVKIKEVLEEKVMPKDIEQISLDKPDYSDFGIDMRSDYNDPDFFEIPAKYDRLLVLNDIHVPYHDIEAVNCALRYGKEHGINAILLNGDIADMVSLSKYETSPNERNFAFEIEKVRLFLSKLKDLFPNVKIFYKLGNHEDRLNRYLMNKAPELYDMVSLRDCLKFDEMDITEIGYLQFIKYGKLLLGHGHEFDSGGGVNVARARLLKAFCNILTAHSHTTQEYLIRTAEGEVFGSWSVGCLCGLRPRYRISNNWNHGFALIYLMENNWFKVENKKIINGVVL